MLHNEHFIGKRTMRHDSYKHSSSAHCLIDVENGKREGKILLTGRSSEMKNVRALLLFLSLSRVPSHTVQLKCQMMNTLYLQTFEIHTQKEMSDENEITEYSGTFLSNVINKPENH